MQFKPSGLVKRTVTNQIGIIWSWLEVEESTMTCHLHALIMCALIFVILSNLHPILNYL